MKIFKGFSTIWKHSNWRFRMGFIMTAFSVFLGFGVYFFPHTDPFLIMSYPTHQGPSLDHWLGTTTIGQDIFWLLINGIHNSLLIGVIVATAGTAIGVLIGLIAGFTGGIVDRILSTITDTFIVVPVLPILILMGSLMQGQATVLTVAVTLSLFSWAWPSRQIRSMALTLRERDFIHTARFSGEGMFQIVTTEILPFALTWSLSNFLNAVIVAIGTETGLAILGLSPATLVSLGNMLQWARARNAIFAGEWIWIGSPIVAISFIFIGLFLLFTGYNDFLSKKRGQ